MVAGEDWKVCQCLSLVGCEPQDTRDAEGKERFLVLSLSQNIHDNFPEWYRRRDVDGSQKVKTD